MSVNLELVPVVMAMKESMGEENFHSWIESMQLRIHTNIKSKEELVKYIQKAGYDAQNWGSSIKTHIDGEKTFFFWDKVEGKWCAIFAKEDSRKMIEDFMEELENKNGIQIFSNTPQLKETPTIMEYKYPTNFNDEHLLLKTLMEYGTNPIKDGNGDIILNIEGTDLRFNKSGEDPYTVEIKTVGNIKQIFNDLSLIDDDYKHNAQSNTYNNLKKNLEDKNLIIDTEEILDDNSIVITLNLQN